MNKKYVYLFSEGNKDMRNLLGGKGANLAEMTLGLSPHLCLRQRRIQDCTWHLSMCMCVSPHVCLCAWQRP